MCLTSKHEGRCAVYEVLLFVYSLVWWFAELRTCHPGYFQCGSGHCIAERFKCDGNADCLDFTDEMLCRECLNTLCAFIRKTSCRRGLDRICSDFQRLAFRTARTAPTSCSSARTTCASRLTGNVMETTTVGTIQTRSFTSAVSNYAGKFGKRFTSVRSRAESCMGFLRIHSGHPV